MKKLKEKAPGFTLIEVIMALAMLMIIMVSVSGLITTVLNSKKFAQQKQEAMLLGQQIMEEIYILDTISKTVDNRYQLDLTSLASLIKMDDRSDVVGMYEQTYGQYKATVNLRKSTESSPELSVQASNDSEEAYIDFEISSTETGFTIKSGSERLDILKDTPITLNMLKQDSGLYEIQLYSVESNKLILVQNNPNIIIRLSDNFNNSSPLILKVTNMDKTATFNLQIHKSVQAIGNLKVEIESGHVRLENNIFDNLDTIGDLYNFTIQIEAYNKKLFETYGNKNLKIG